MVGMSELERPVRSDSFESAWAVLGALGFAGTVIVSWAIWMAFNEPAHCGYLGPCPVDAVVELGLRPWSVAWAGWFLAGCVTWILGAESRAWWRGPAVALLVGTAVFGAGIVTTGYLLLEAIDATHGP